MLIRKIKNWFGSIKGYGGCLRCGDTWDRKEGKKILYDEKESRLMFPLCTECFDELDEQKILFYCKSLLDKWIQCADSMRIIKNYDYYIETLKKNIRLLKGENEK